MSIIVLGGLMLNTFNVVAQDPPTIIINESICAGESITLTNPISNPNFHDWSTGDNTSSITVTPFRTTIYKICAPTGSFAEGNLVKNHAHFIVTVNDCGQTPIPAPSCEEDQCYTPIYGQPLARFTLDECAGDDSYSEFSAVTSNNNCSNVSNMKLGSTYSPVGHPMEQSFPMLHGCDDSFGSDSFGTENKRICLFQNTYGSTYNQVQNAYNYVEVTVDPSTCGSISGFQFNLDIFEYGDGTPSKLYLRVKKNGSEIYLNENVLINPNGSYAFYPFDFTNIPDFQFTTTSTFRFEFLPYAEDGSDPWNMMELDDITIYGGCGTVIPASNPPNANASNNGPLTCENGTTQLSASGGSSYAWTGPNGFSSTLQNPTVSSSGTYTVTVTGNNGCIDSASTTVTQIPCLIDLELIKSVDKPQVNVGENVTWTISVVNEGPSIATGVSVGDFLPSGVTFLNANTANGSINTNNLIWTIGTIAVNQTVTLNITTSVDQAGSFNNMAEVISANEDDLDSTPNNMGAGPSEDDEDDATTTAAEIELAGLGNFTFLDYDDNGMYDPSFEEPLKDVTVYLYDAANLDAPLDSKVTDINGYYEFIDLDPSLDYVVQFGEVLGTTRSGPSFPSSEGEDDKNDADFFTGFTDVINLDPGEFDPTIDAGYVTFRGINGAFVLLQGATQTSAAEKFGPTNTGSIDNFKANEDWEMRTNLVEDNMLPLEDPYESMPQFLHINNSYGTEIITDSDVLSTSSPTPIVDWVFLDLRSADNPTETVITRSVLVQKDGRIVDVDGNTSIALDVDYGEYHIAIRHRNHLGVMTAQPYTIGGLEAPIIDFRDPNLATWGNNAQVYIDPTTTALWSGDANSDGRLIFQGENGDNVEGFFDVLSAPENSDSQINYIHTDYKCSDLDLNCEIIYQGTNNDNDERFFNILLHPENAAGVTNFIIDQQIPE